MKDKVYFKNSAGIRLCGILSCPTANADNPVVVMCHGFSTSKDSRTSVRLEEILNDQGISTFRFDFFGHGESEGEFEEITTSEAIDDVLNAIKFVKESGHNKTGLMGSSFGGMASLIAASRSDNPGILALKSPLSDYRSMAHARHSEPELKDWKEKGFIEFESAEEEKQRLNYSFYEDAENVKAYEAARKIKIPALIVHGDKDETVPLSQSQKTARLIENCRLEIIKGCDHVYSDPEHFERMLGLISEFIIKNSR